MNTLHVAYMLWEMAIVEQSMRVCVFLCVYTARQYLPIDWRKSYGREKSCNDIHIYTNIHMLRICVYIHIRVRMLTAFRRVIQLLYGIMCDNTLFLICTFVCAGSFVRGDVSTHVGKVTVWHVIFGTEFIKYKMMIKCVRCYFCCICQMW